MHTSATKARPTFHPAAAGARAPADANPAQNSTTTTRRRMDQMGRGADAWAQSLGAAADGGAEAVAATLGGIDISLARMKKSLSKATNKKHAPKDVNGNLGPINNGRLLSKARKLSSELDSLIAVANDPSVRPAISEKMESLDSLASWIERLDGAYKVDPAVVAVATKTRALEAALVAPIKSTEPAGPPQFKIDNALTKNIGPQPRKIYGLEGSVTVEQQPGSNEITFEIYQKPATTKVDGKAVAALEFHVDGYHSQGLVVTDKGQVKVFSGTYPNETKEIDSFRIGDGTPIKQAFKMGDDKIATYDAKGRMQWFRYDGAKIAKNPGLAPFIKFGNFFRKKSDTFQELDAKCFPSITQLDQSQRNDKQFLLHGPGDDMLLYNADNDEFLTVPTGFYGSVTASESMMDLLWVGDSNGDVRMFRTSDGSVKSEFKSDLNDPIVAIASDRFVDTATADSNNKIQIWDWRSDFSDVKQVIDHPTPVVKMRITETQLITVDDQNVQRTFNRPWRP